MTTMTTPTPPASLLSSYETIDAAARALDEQAERLRSVLDVLYQQLSDEERAALDARKV